MYPGFASVDAVIGVLALFAGMGICTNITPPQREESPERPLCGFLSASRTQPDSAPLGGGSSLDVGACR